MKIAGVEVGERPLVLAPMEDVTNPPFRKFCKAFGADWLYSEFVSADALVRSVNKSLKKLTIDDSERPVTIQIYGRFVDSMVEAARIVEEVQPDFIDLNFGCPVKRVAQKGAGAGLLRDVPLMVEMARQVVNAVKLPVTAKTRLGWDSEHIIIEDIAERLQDVGIRALAIHGRTRAQMYTGEADWRLIGEVKRNPRMAIPIIGNGDVTSAEICARRFEEYGVDGVMIGRASIGRPWVFREVKHYLRTGEPLPPESFGWYLDILKRQVEQSVERLDERRGILHIRRHLAATPLFKGIKDFKQTRIAMLRAETVAELFEIMDSIPQRFEISTPDA